MIKARQTHPVDLRFGPSPTPIWLAPGRPYPAIMGILNVTPDSFSDGGQFLEPDKALAQVQRMIAEGADIIDIGAESTRPYGGQKPVPADEEMRRLAPLLRDVIGLGTPVSVDTMKAEVASFALDAGAAILNDVWGLQGDPDMASVAAEYQVPVVAMHNRSAADPAIDIIKDIAEFFSRTLEIAARAGIPKDKLILDPGIGFGKTSEQSLTVLARLAELRRFGCPLLIGASRKRFIASVAASEPDQRLGGSLAAHLLSAQNGAAIVRVHDVAETVQAFRVAAAIGSGR